MSTPAPTAAPTPAPTPAATLALRERVVASCREAGTKPVFKHYPYYASKTSKTLQRFVDAAAAATGPLVSVGSGMAFMESLVCREMMRLGKDPEVWCIDRDPMDYNPFRGPHGQTEPFIRPVQPTLTALMRNDPGTFEYLATHPNLTLLLVWCYPDAETGSSGYEYDVEAIFRLKADRVVALYEGGGAAGTANFFRWMDRLQGVVPREKEDGTLEEGGLPNYKFDEPRTGAEVLENGGGDHLYVVVDTFIKTAPERVWRYGK